MSPVTDPSSAGVAGLVAVSCDFYLDPCTPLLLAMVQAEGGREAFVTAIQCSGMEVRTFEEALARACKTIRNRLVEYLGEAEDGGDHTFEMVRRQGIDPWTGEKRPRCLAVTRAFIRFLASTWAPPGAENDPHNLNANWPGNVERIYADLCNLVEEEWT